MSAAAIVSDITQTVVATAYVENSPSPSFLDRVPVFFGATDLGLHHPLLLVFNGVLSCKLEESLQNFLVSWNLVEADRPYRAFCVASSNRFSEMMWLSMTCSMDEEGQSITWRVKAPSRI